MVLLCPAFILAQDAAPRQILYLDDWTYDLIAYGINNGTFNPQFVLNQPYDVAEVKAGLAPSGRWRELILPYLDRFYGTPGTGKLILYGRNNVSVVSESELPLRSGARAAPFGEVALFDNRSKNHYNVAAQFNLNLPHLSLVNRTSINSEFLDDPLYPGDTGEWIYGRLQDAFANVTFGSFDLFLGRTDRNWGMPGSPSMILSNNPYSYDHAQFSYRAGKIKFSMLVSRLEDLQGLNVQSDFPDSLFHARKYLTTHRIDLALSKRLQLGFTELAMYGGPGRDFEFSYLNPMSYFYLVQRNTGQEISGLWAIDFFYAPAKQWNVFAQVLLDDIILNNDDPGERDRNPDRLGIQLRVSQADRLLQGLQTGLEYTRLGNRTYQAFRTWENFQTREKGLGYPAASVERLSVFANYFDLFPAIIKVTAAYQRSGDARLTDVFRGGKAPKFPVGVVETTWQAEARIRYLLNPWSQLTARVGVERIKNFGHVAGEDFTNVALVLGAQVNLSLSMSLVEEKPR